MENHDLQLLFIGGAVVTPEPSVPPTRHVCCTPCLLTGTIKRCTLTRSAGLRFPPQAESKTMATNCIATAGQPSLLYCWLCAPSHRSKVMHKPTSLQTHPAVKRILFVSEWAEIALNPPAGLDGRSVALPPLCCPRSRPLQGPQQTAVARYDDFVPIMLGGAQVKYLCFYIKNRRGARPPVSLCVHLIPSAKYEAETPQHVPSKNSTLTLSSWRERQPKTAPPPPLTF